MAQRDTARHLEEGLEECEEDEVVGVVLVHETSTATRCPPPMLLALRRRWGCGEIVQSRR